jgi:hypothetical protein
LGYAAAIVGGTSSLVAGYMGAKAAKDAARTTSDATVRAALIQQEMYEQGREDLAPYRESGYTALEDIESLKPYLTSQVWRSSNFASILTQAWRFA